MAAAGPGTRSYAGQVALEPESSVTFKVRKKENGAKKVKSVAFEGVTAGCFAEGVHTQVGGAIPGSDKAKKGKFKLEYSDPVQQISFSGELKSRGKAASGTLRFSGMVEVDGTTRTCDTGPRNWSAERV